MYSLLGSSFNTVDSKNSNFLFHGFFFNRNNTHHDYIRTHIQIIPEINGSPEKYCKIYALGLFDIVCPLSRNPLQSTTSVGLRSREHEGKTHWRGNKQ